MIGSDRLEDKEITLEIPGVAYELVGSTESMKYDFCFFLNQTGNINRETF